MLTQTLRWIYAEVPPRVGYVLTPLGQTLVEPMAALHAWAIEHVEEIEASRAGSAVAG